MPLSAAPVTMASNCSPMRGLSSRAAADFSTCRSTLLAASSCVGAVAGQLGQLIHAVAGRRPAMAAFNRRWVIRSVIAAVGRGGMGVVFHRQAKVPRAAPPGISATYSPEPNSLITARDRSGKRTGSAAFCFTRKASRLSESGVCGQGRAVLAASSTIRSQRLGVRTTRRMRGEFPGGQKAGGDPVGGDHEIFDDFFGAVLLFHLQPRICSSSNTGIGLDGFQAQGAAGVAERFQRCAAWSCRRRLSSSPRHGGRLLRAGAGLAFQPGCHAVVGQLGVIVHPARGRGLASAPSRPRRPRHSTTMARRSSSLFSEVRSVESCSGSMGKISAAV